ncbi:MAG TPA: transposase [Gemmatimonadales bacterium]|nr:transposase [Gemmatimonadales bacterium]
MDETGHTFRARVGTTWVPVGQPPVLPRVSKRREVSSIVVLTAPLEGGAPRLYARHFVGSIHGAEVIAALRIFRRRIGRSLIVVWGHLQAHKARAVTEFLAAHPEDFAVEWLPGYAPDLNPEEQCNAVVKNALLNALPDSVEEMRAQVRREFRRLARRPDVLRGFFRRAGLDVK